MLIDFSLYLIVPIKFLLLLFLINLTADHVDYFTIDCVQPEASCADVVSAAAAAGSSTHTHHEQGNYFIQITERCLEVSLVESEFCVIKLIKRGLVSTVIKLELTTCS